MQELTIPVLSGDGVGPELAEAARACLDAVNGDGARFNLPDHPIGYTSYRQSGNALPDETLEAMRRAPATILTAFSVKECPPPSLMGQIRQKLGLVSDIRHCLSGPGSRHSGVDLIMFRECSEGFLADRNMYQGSGEFMPSPDVALSVRVVTRAKSDTIARLAFEYARRNGRKKITVAHKDVVFSLSCGLFRQCVDKQAADFPDITLDQELVDDLAGHLVATPERYDMILTTNMFGDILADVAAAQVGAMLPIINANDHTALFCPVHAPHNDIARQQRVNPVVILRTVSAMLHWLNLPSAGRRVDQALASALDAPLCQSLVLPAGLTTREVTARVLRSLPPASG